MQCLILNKKQLRLIDLLHVLPILIFWLGYGDVLLMEGNIRSAYINAHFLTRTMFWNYLLAFQMMLYAIGSSVFLYLNRSQLSKKRFQYAVFLVVSYVCSSILISYLTHFAEGWRDFAWYYVLVTFLIFGVGYFLVKNS